MGLLIHGIFNTWSACPIWALVFNTWEFYYMGFLVHGLGVPKLGMGFLIHGFAQHGQHHVEHYLEHFVTYPQRGGGAAAPPLFIS